MLVVVLSAVLLAPGGEDADEQRPRVLRQAVAAVREQRGEVAARGLRGAPVAVDEHVAVADAGRASAAQRWTIALLRRGKAAAHRRARDFDAALGELRGVRQGWAWIARGTGQPPDVAVVLH